MSYFFFVPIAVICALAAVVDAGELRLDHRRDALSLEGEWTALLEHGDENVWDSAVADGLGPWKPVDVPGSNLVRADDDDRSKLSELHRQTAHVWLRRSLTLTAEQAARGAVLKWGGIRFGAAAWVNGAKVADHTPVGPCTAMLPENLLRTGDNIITLRICGWNGVAKSKSGYPLTPTGGSTQSWGAKGPGIYQDIWMEFYDVVYLRHVLAMPDVSEKTVNFRIRLDGHEQQTDKVRIAVEVRTTDGETLLGAAETTLAVGDSSGSVTCQLDNVIPWTPATPQLYEARVRAINDERVCDDVRIAFGMREIAIEDGHFRLNGKPLWLRGSNLVNEWLWGDLFNENVKSYLIDEARSMNLNCFRTHTQPPPSLWVDTADQHGMMILAEMPLLYNHADFKYTPEELEILHKNALLDAEGWITKLWNHPSVIMWVLSNESRHDNEWEAGPCYEHAKALDPTRPCMRTGEEKVGTPDIVDTHTCFNVVSFPEGRLIVNMTSLMGGKDPARALTNTEYMNWMWDPSARWLGREKHPDMPLVYAEFAAEHTEAMRRLQFDCLLPYMYAGWTRLRGKMSWRVDYPTPMSAALHSVMSPVLASLDMFDRNYVVGKTIEVPLTLINETHEPIVARVDLYITPDHPLFVPDADALAAAVWQESKDLVLEADSLRSTTVRLPVPGAEGTYYVAAVLTRDGDTPVVSQRVLRAIDPDKYANALSGRRVAVFGDGASVREFLDRRGCTVVDGLAAGPVNADAALIDDAELLHVDARQPAAARLRAFAESGGRIVVLQHPSWPWKELADCELGLPEHTWRNPVACSRVHAFEGVDHPMLRDIPVDWLWRWNGLPGVIANQVVLKDSIPDDARKLLWIAKEEFTAALSLPVGKGEILFCQLKLRDRIDPAADTYDPVADRVLVNLLRP